MTAPRKPQSANGPGRRTVPDTELDALAAPHGSLDLDLVVSLPTLPLRARYLVESFLTGRHRSPIKGTAPEFAEYRTYQIGDELRRIDWRLYARSDRLAVKQFEDENQLHACLALDVSASLRYASRPGLMTKLDLARTTLAAISLLARRQSDAVGLALVGDTGNPADSGLLDFLRPSASLAQHHTVYARLESPPAARGAPLGAALRRIASLLTRGGIVVVASDFYVDLDELRAALRLFRAQRLELIGLHVLDPMEIELGGEIAGRFVDLEDGAYLPLNTAAVRRGYLERFSAFRAELLELFQEHGADLVPLRTDDSPLAALAAYFGRRARLA